MTLRDTIQKKIEKEYDVSPEYLWKRYPTYAVYRHSDNRKWFAIIMNVEYRSLGIDKDGRVDIVDVKCESAMAGSLRRQDGILPGYHMNHLYWNTILLDGTVPEDQILMLLDISFGLTDRSAKKSSGSHITQWLIPANPKYFDVDAAFDQEDIILWKQSSNIQVGDTIYMYVAAPFSAIRYKCRAVEVNIPYEYADDNVRMKYAMRIQKLAKYDKSPIGRDILQAHGVFYVRGPRSIPASLVREIESLYRKNEL